MPFGLGWQACAGLFYRRLASPPGLDHFNPSVKTGTPPTNDFLVLMDDSTLDQDQQKSCYSSGGTTDL
jgi:hypothetical protein